MVWIESYISDSTLVVTHNLWLWDLAPRRLIFMFQTFGYINSQYWDFEVEWWRYKCCFSRLEIIFSRLFSALKHRLLPAIHRGCLLLAGKTVIFLFSLQGRERGRFLLGSTPRLASLLSGQQSLLFFPSASCPGQIVLRPRQMVGVFYRGWLSHPLILSLSSPSTERFIVAFISVGFSWLLPRLSPLGYHLGSIEDELREDLWCLDSYAESKQAGGWANRLLLDYEGIESDLPMLLGMGDGAAKTPWALTESRR
jgi:hypothetical protein